MLEYTEPVPISELFRSELFDFAVDAAVKAGDQTLPFFRTTTIIENKLDDGRFDPVTEADKTAEKALRELIALRYPDHGICGEEYGTQTGNGLTWVIDPIDGTRAFMSGMLHWGLLLALFDGARPVIGVMYQPYTGELWCGDGRSSEFRKDREVRTLSVPAALLLAVVLLTTTSPEWFDMRNRAGFARLEAAVKLSRYGGDCYIYAMLAMGFVDLAADGNLHPYDIQALIPIIEGAGGVISAVDGSDASMGGTVIASGTRRLHEAALRLLSD